MATHAPTQRQALKISVVEVCEQVHPQPPLASTRARRLRSAPSSILPLEPTELPKLTYTMDTPAPEILLFARGVVALLDLWPALTIAVREQWGGIDSADKKTFLASEIVELFDTRADRLPSGAIDPKNAAEPPLDQDQIADLLAQVMSDEFEAAVEDDSLDPLAADIVRVWRDIVNAGAATEEEAKGRGEEVVSALERKAAEVSRQGVRAQSGGGEVEVDSEGEEWESDDEEAPQLVAAEPREPRERQEPVVDDDGFTLVQKPRRR